MIPFISAFFRKGEGEQHDIFRVISERWGNLTNGEVIIIFASEKKKGVINYGKGSNDLETIHGIDPF